MHGEAIISKCIVPLLLNPSLKLIACFYPQRFDPNFVCNASDDGGRYAYKQQPGICHWNLARLAEALSPELPSERSGPLLNDFQPEFDARFSENMHRKLGLRQQELPRDPDLVSSLLETMHSTGLFLFEFCIC